MSKILKYFFLPAVVNYIKLVTNYYYAIFRLCFKAVYKLSTILIGVKTAQSCTAMSDIHTKFHFIILIGLK